MAKRADYHDFGDFAGFFAVHFLWQTEGHENVVPMVVSQDGGQPGLERFEASEYAQAAQQAADRYEDIKNAQSFTLLALDGYIQFRGGKHEAVIIQAHFQSDEPYDVLLAIPYVWTAKGQRIYDVQVGESNLPDIKAFLVDFYKGAARHVQGLDFWQTHME